MIISLVSTVELLNQTNFNLVFMLSALNGHLGLSFRTVIEIILKKVVESDHRCTRGGGWGVEEYISGPSRQNVYKTCK